MRSYKVFTLFVFLLITATIYSFGLSGPFLLDDFSNLEPLANYGGITDWDSALRFVFGNNSGPLGRPVAMASFLLNDSSWPSNNVFSFKLTNVILHLSVGLVLFLVLSRLFIQEFKIRKQTSETLALLVLFVWLLHPIQVSTVLYVVQRMTIFSALFTLSAFLFYLRFRFYCTQNDRVVAAVNFLLLSLSFILALYSKENAVLLIPFIVICELFLFESILSNKVKVTGRYVLIILLITSPVWLYLSFNLWGGGYLFRDFDLIDRVILQISVLGDYVGKLILPTAQRMNLFDNRFSVSSISIYNSSFVIGILLFASYIYLYFCAAVKKQRLLVFGFTWFLFFHLLESTILPLEIYFEHRNYLPSVGIFIAMIAGLNYLFEKLTVKKIVFIVAIPYLFLLVFITSILSNTWGNTSLLLTKFEGDEPNSIRAKVIYSEYLEGVNLPEIAISVLDEAIELKPELLSLVISKVRMICLYDFDYDRDKIIYMLKQATLVDSSIIYHLRKILEIKGSRCSLLSDGVSIIEDILHRIPSMKGFGSHFGSQFYYLKSDYFTEKLIFGEALDAIDHAINYAPTVDLFLKKAVLLTSAGLYVEALGSLSEALEANKRRGYFIPSREEEIQFLETSLTAQLNKQ